MDYICAMSDCLVVSAKQGNEAEEGVGVETGWLECEKATVPVPRRPPHDGRLSCECNAESPGGSVDCGESI